MSIREAINNAIVTRREFREQLVSYEKDLLSWSNYANCISEYIEDPCWARIINTHSCKNTVQQWEVLVKNTNELKEILNELGFANKKTGIFTKALTRAKRDYVNLGIVGTFRQGKSTLLSQLIKIENPNSSILFPVNGGDDACTGAPVNYINHLYEISEDETKVQFPAAVIKYYTSGQMCDLINEYLVECELDRTIWGEIKNKTKEGLRAYCNAHKTEALSIKNAQPNTLHKTLQSLIINGAIPSTSEQRSFIELLDCPDDLVPLNTENNIKKYIESISFYDTLTGNLNDRKFLVYATREADVYIKFLLDGEDVGSIRFLDTPGTGEKRLGVNSGLAAKLQNDLDLIIAINKLEEAAQNDTTVNDFHNILKNKFDCECKVNGEDFKSSLFIYYMINYALNDTTLAQNNQLLYSRYKRIFTDGIEITPNSIYLKRDHKIIINCKDNKYYDYDVNDNEQIINITLNNDKNCQTFLKDAIEHLSSIISSIDAYFAADAIKLYGDAKSKLEQIIVQVNGLVLPQLFEPSKKIGELLKEMYAELKGHSARIDITKAIAENIASYAASDTIGCEVMKLFNLPTYSEEDEEIKNRKAKIQDKYKDKELHKTEIRNLLENEIRKDRLKNIKSKIQEDYNNKLQIKDSKSDESKSELQDELLDSLSEEISEEIEASNSDFCNSFEALHEFGEYSSTKFKFYEQCGNDIKLLIDDSDAQKRIQQKKNDILEQLRRREWLGFIHPEPSKLEDWYNALMTLLIKEGRSSLYNHFAALHDFKLDIASQIDTHILATIKPQFHKDLFKNALFNTSTWTRISFIRSYLNIELRVKESLRMKEQSLIELLRNNCNDEFKNCVSEFSHIAYIDVNKQIDNGLYEEMRGFLSHHFDDIMKCCNPGSSDQSFILQSKINDWNKLSKTLK